ncbi:lysozyme [Phenylobacterium sp.]|uniref:lysozyme n=1 Tax=Phenylobacterium sp. TaxID=1871053 RepID=UPI002810C384|nr:lysozyme [Phenylobacterium sp.]
MSRKELMDCARLFAPEQKLTQPMVDLLDKVADLMGFPRIGETPAGMKVSQAGIDLIHSFESFQPKAYRDPGSRDGLPITIGWGSTSDEQGRPIKLGDVWTRERADARFAKDLEKYERGVLDALAGAPVTQGQFDALVSFAYNVGLQALRESTLLKLHKAGDYGGAHRQFGRWVKNDGKTLAGLVRRRAAEAALYGR